LGSRPVQVTGFWLATQVCGELPLAGGTGLGWQLTGCPCTPVSR